MTNPINKLATLLYVQHTTCFGQKDLSLDLSSTGELKVVHDTWHNRLVLFVKNLFSLGTRNETILNLAKQAWGINNCDSLEALQNVEIKWDNTPIDDTVAERFALMSSDRKYVQESGSITFEKKNSQISMVGEYCQEQAAERFAARPMVRNDAQASVTLIYKRYQNPLVDIKLIPMKEIRGRALPSPFEFKEIGGILLPAPLADKVNLLLTGNVGIFAFCTIGDQYGEVSIQVGK